MGGRIGGIYMTLESLLSELEEYLIQQINESFKSQIHASDWGLEEQKNIMRGKVSAYQDLLTKIDNMRNEEKSL